MAGFFTNLKENITRAFGKGNSKTPLAPSPIQVTPVAVNMPTEYQRFQTQIDGYTAQIEVTFDYQTSKPPMGTHADLLELVVRLNRPDQLGLMTPEEEKEVTFLRNEILKQIPNPIYVGSVTSNGLHNSFIYLPTGITVPPSLRSLNVPQQFSFEVKPDNGWQYYTELLPTLEEGERMVNQRQIAELNAQGIDTSKPLELVHTITCPIATTDKLVEVLQQLGYEVFNIEASDTEPESEEIKFRKVSNLMLDYITAETIQLYNLAEESQGNYVNWTLGETQVGQSTSTIKAPILQPKMQMQQRTQPIVNQTNNNVELHSLVKKLAGNAAIDHRSNIILSEAQKAHLRTTNNPFKQNPSAVHMTMSAPLPATNNTVTQI